MKNSMKGRKFTCPIHCCIFSVQNSAKADGKGSIVFVEEMSKGKDEGRNFTN